MVAARIATALAGLILGCCAGTAALGQGNLPTQSTDIPLQYVFDRGTNQPRLAINVGINGGTPQPYLFDTGSTIFNAAYNPSTWNNFGGATVPASTVPNGNGIQLCYSGSSPGECRGYTGNIVQVPILTFYAPGAAAGSAPAATLTASTGFQINAVYSYTDPNNGINDSFPSYFNDPSAPPPQEGLFYGVFGARASVDLLNKQCAAPDCYVSGGVLGQTIVPGAVSQGYVVAANGQPNPTNAASPGGTNPPYGTQMVTIGGQVQPVTSCNPCVTVGLTPQLIGQFAPVGLPAQTPALPGVVPWISQTPAPPSFPNPYGGGTGNNSAPTDSVNFTVTLTPTGGPSTTFTVPGLLDTGTRDFALNGNYPSALTGSISIVGATPNGASIPGLPTSTSTLNGGVAYVAESGGSNPSNTIGIPFFMQNSVMFDLSDRLIGYTPFFVTAAPLATTANGPLIIGSSNVPLGLAGAVSGPGGVVIQSGGAAQLSATNTYTGPTSIAAASGGSPAGLLLVSGPGSIAASAGVANDGVFDISRAWSAISIQTLSGAGQVNLGGQNLIVTNASTTFSGTMADGGNFPATGGSLTLTGGTLGFAGVGTFTGGTFVNGGTLVLSGSLSGPIGVSPGGAFVLAPGGSFAGQFANLGTMSVNGVVTGIIANLGTISGTGTIAGSLVNGGALAPGNSIGTLTVNGTFTQGASGTYQVETNAAGQADLVNVVGVPGTATLGGAVVLASATGIYGPSTTYRIVSATGGVTGTFAGVTSLYPFLQPSLSYDAKNVFLTVRPGGFAAGAATPNQAAVGAALDRGVAGATGDFATVIGLMSTMSASQGQATMNAISGQNYAGLSSNLVQSSQLFMNAFALQAGGRSRAGSTRVALAEACDVACDAAAPGLWGAWGGAIGGVGSIAGNGNAGTLTYNLGGFAAGIDRLVDDDVRVGFALGYSNGSQWTDGFSGRGAADTIQAAVYASLLRGPFHLDALAGYAYSNNRLQRQIVIAGLSARTAYGQANANQFFGQVEFGYRLELGGAPAAYVIPFARLQGSTATQNGFTESGAGSLNLSVAAQTTNSLRSVLGATIGGAMDLGWRDALAVQFKLGWGHEFASTDRPVTASFAGAPAIPFTTYGAAPQRDGVIVGFNASTAIAERTSFYVRYEGEILGQDNNHAGTIGVRMTW
jgi:uncharacterized protein with beta-barrel porin domain